MQNGWYLLRKPTVIICVNSINIKRAEFHNAACQTSATEITFSRNMLKHTFQVPIRVFAENEPKFVLILTYQRCGSTFFGQLFNKNPEVFYLFEPLDALYAAFYGIEHGWSVPSDITNYRNGSHR